MEFIVYGDSAYSSSLAMFRLWIVDQWSRIVAHIETLALKSEPHEMRSPPWFSRFYTIVLGRYAFSNLLNSRTHVNVNVDVIAIASASSQQAQLTFSHLKT